MLVCICKGVSETRIREEIRRGAQSVEQLQTSCRGAGTDCGTCLCAMQELLEKRDERADGHAPL